MSCVALYHSLCIQDYHDEKKKTDHMTVGLILVSPRHYVLYFEFLILNIPTVWIVSSQLYLPFMILTTLALPDSIHTRICVEVGRPHARKVIFL